MEFLVKDCDPQTGDVDEEGYDDSYNVRFDWLSLMFIVKFTRVRDSLTMLR